MPSYGFQPIEGSCLVFGLHGRIVPHPTPGGGGVKGGSSFGVWCCIGFGLAVVGLIFALVTLIANLVAAGEAPGSLSTLRWHFGLTTLAFGTIRSESPSGTSGPDIVDGGPGTDTCPGDNGGTTVNCELPPPRQTSRQALAINESGTAGPVHSRRLGSLYAVRPLALGPATGTCPDFAPMCDLEESFGPHPVVVEDL